MTSSHKSSLCVFASGERYIVAIGQTSAHSRSPEGNQSHKTKPSIVLNWVIVQIIKLNELPYCYVLFCDNKVYHYGDVMMGAMASQITSITIVYATIYSGADQWNHQSSASLAFMRGNHWCPVSSLHKGPVTRKTFPFDDIIVTLHRQRPMVHLLLSELINDSGLDT